MDGSLPGSSVHGVFQARVLEWGAIASSELNSCPGLTPKNCSFLVLLFLIDHLASGSGYRPHPQFLSFPSPASQPSASPAGSNSRDTQNASLLSCSLLPLSKSPSPPAWTTATTSGLLCLLPSSLLSMRNPGWFLKMVIPSCHSFAYSRYPTGLLVPSIFRMKSKSLSFGHMTLYAVPHPFSLTTSNCVPAQAHVWPDCPCVSSLIVPSSLTPQGWWT